MPKKKPVSQFLFLWRAVAGRQAGVSRQASGRRAGGSRQTSARQRAVERAGAGSRASGSRARGSWQPAAERSATDRRGCGSRQAGGSRQVRGRQAAAGRAAAEDNLQPVTTVSQTYRNPYYFDDSMQKKYYLKTMTPKRTIYYQHYS